MKNLLLAALVAVTIGTSAFAADVSKVSRKILYNFEVQFPGASDVSWSFGNTYTKASFTLAEEKVEAYFAADGEMIGLSRKIDTDIRRLPLNALQKIKKNYAGYKVTDAIEFDQNGDKTFYVSLTNGVKKAVLEVSSYGNVSIFDKNKY